jgi:hypothetical protein
MIALQNLIPRAQMSVSMAVLVFCLNLGASVLLQFSLTVFSQGLLHTIPKYAPTVNPKEIIQAGATRFRDDIPSTELPVVLIAYAKSINHGFYLVAGAATTAFVFAWGMGWEDVRKYREKPENPEDIEISNL